MSLKEVDLNEQFNLNIDPKRLDRKVEDGIRRSQKQKKATGRSTKAKRKYIAERAEALKAQFGL